MRKRLFFVPSIFAWAACGPNSLYVLPPDVPAGETRQYRGTVLSVEEDGDFLLEVDRRLLFVDVGDREIEVELRQDRDRSRLAFLYDAEAPEPAAGERDAADSGEDGAEAPSRAGDGGDGAEPDVHEAPDPSAVTPPALDASEADSKVSPSAPPPV